MTQEHASSDAMTAIERVIARDEIRQLAYRYALAIDSRDIDLLVSLFVPDVRIGPNEAGTEALRKLMIGSLRAIGVSILFVGNHLIDFDDPDHAHGTVYCRAQVQDGVRWIEQAIMYRDTYERHDGRWRFVWRIHELWYGVETAERPMDQGAANWPAHHVGRGTLPESLPTWKVFWSTVGT